MDTTKAFGQIIEYAIHFGIVGGSLTFVWYLIKKMVDDLGVQFQVFSTKMNLALNDLESETSKKLEENSSSCRDLRGSCMAERGVLKKEYMSESLHKIVSTSTQRDLKLHVSGENKQLLSEIQSNKEIVIRLINDLRNDLKKNGSI